MEGLSLISMSRSEARKAFLDYKRAVKERHDAEDEAIMRGYRVLAQGKQLISLAETIQRGGFVEKVEQRWDHVTKRSLPIVVLLPALACCRAHLKECWVSTESNGTVTFLSDPYYRGRKDRVSISGFEQRGLVWSNADWKAMVPIIPPGLRPAHHLRNYHILWEADWKKTRPPAPRDPVLLKHIRGDLYAVVAMWELTKLERAVLSGRA